MVVLVAAIAMVGCAGNNNKKKSATCEKAVCEQCEKAAACEKAVECQKAECQGECDKADCRGGECKSGECKSDCGKAIASLTRKPQSSCTSTTSNLFLAI